MVIETYTDQEINMIDFKFLKGLKDHTIFEQKIETRNTDDQRFWFLIFLSAKKFMRNDNLIGTHLLLDNLKLLLEAEMMERDRLKKTNIHRFGEEENIDELLALSQLKLDGKNKIINYLNAVGEKYDQVMLKKVKDYELKTPYLLRYLKR